MSDPVPVSTPTRTYAGERAGAPAREDGSVPALDTPALDTPALDTPALDTTVLDTLIARLGERGPAFRTTLINTWITESELRLRELEEADTAEDAGGVARIAHALRGGSASLGAHRLAEVCREIEEEFRGAGGDAARIREAAATIRTHTHAAEQELRALLE